MTTLWGIDLGGTKIEGAVFDHRSPESPYARIRLNTGADRGYEHILLRIQELLLQLKQISGQAPAQVGFSTPGTLDPASRTMKNCNTVCMNGKPMQRDLEQLLSIPVLLQNDANCFALTEATFGAARDAEVVFGVIMGTGIGGGIVIDKRVIGGAQGIAGEWGHTILDAAGPECYCGRKGCVETIMAGPKLEQYYTLLSGRYLPLQEIGSAARSGSDPHAANTIDRLTTHFAKAISQVINILDPSAIVLGGGVSNLEELYSPLTRQKIAAEIFNNSFETPLLKNQLGDSAGVFGAGYLCLETP